MHHLTIVDPDGLITETVRPSKAAVCRYVETLPNVAADRITVRDDNGKVVGFKRVGVTRVAWAKANQELEGMQT
jgi:predicted metal-dependent TIM-barrel fold hydrolase